MSDQLFRNLMLLCSLSFLGIFCVVVAPAFIATPDVVNFFTSGFVNPFSSGYSADVIICGVILFIWIIYEALNNDVKHGWICVILSIVPGVAFGFALYLILRHKQIKNRYEPDS